MNTHEELQDLLAQYRGVEHEIEKLEDQKKALRASIQRALEDAGKTLHLVTLEHERIVLTLKSRTEIRYNEDILRARLGSTYLRILQPDVTKIKTHLDELRSALTPYLEKIGSPSRTKIKELITHEQLDPHLFHGAFEKTQKTTLYVKKRVLSDEPPPDELQE